MPMLILIFIIACMLIQCDNPFLPPTGEPILVKSMRSTPAGVIKQLCESYESRNIALFTDLLSKKETFRFYVAPGFDQNRYNNKYAHPPEKPDTFMQFVRDGYYYYWDYDAEVKSHSNLFAEAELLMFTSEPEIMNVNYVRNDSGDTIMAEVQTQYGEFEVDRYEDASLVAYIVSIQTQVFLMEKDPDGLWVIRKWYDLGNEEL